MSDNASPFRWRERSLVMRIAFVVVTSVIFLYVYVEVSGNQLAMRTFSLGIAALVFV